LIRCLIAPLGKIFREFHRIQILVLPGSSAPS
jgi:hypothetical protein